MMSEQPKNQQPAAAPTPCVHADDPKACYRVRCQLGGKCVDDDMSPRTAPSPADERAALWQTGTPPTKAGDYDEYIIAVRRKTNPARVFVFASNYANEYIDDNEDDEQKPRTGWYLQAADMGGEYAYVYEQTLNEGDEVLGWQALPKWNDEARAASANETGAEGAAIPAGYALVPIERSYDMRAKALIAFNTTEQSGKDRDDALDAAYRAELAAAPQPVQADARVGPTDEQILNAFRDAGIDLNATPNMAYTVRGQQAQLVNAVRALLQGANHA